MKRNYYISRNTEELRSTLYDHEFRHEEPLKYSLIIEGTVVPFERTEDYQSVGGVLNGDGETEAFSEDIHIDIYEKERIRKPRLSCTTGDINGKDIKIVHEKVIYLGSLDTFYGHFLTDSLSRLWFILEYPEFKDYKYAYISDKGEHTFSGIYELFGIKKEDLIFINDPVRFDEIIVPEPSFRYMDMWHTEYKNTIDRICQNCLKFKGNIIRHKYDKIYFTRSRYSGAAKGSIGEKPVEKIFKRAGFKIISPERLTLTEQILLMADCSELAGLSGTAMHNALWMKDGSKVHILNRSDYIMPVQYMIDEIRDLYTDYVDAGIECFPVNNWGYPYFVGLTGQLREFAKKNGYDIREKDFKADLGRDYLEFLKKWTESYNRIGGIPESVLMNGIAERLAEGLEIYDDRPKRKIMYEWIRAQCKKILRR